MLKKVCCILSKLLYLLHHIRRVLANSVCRKHRKYKTDMLQHIFYIYSLAKTDTGVFVLTRISRCCRDNEDSLGVPRCHCSSPLQPVKGVTYSTPIPIKISFNHSTETEIVCTSIAQPAGGGHSTIGQEQFLKLKWTTF